MNVMLFNFVSQTKLVPISILRWMLCPLFLFHNQLSRSMLRSPKNLYFNPYSQYWCNISIFNLLGKLVNLGQLLSIAWRSYNFGIGYLVLYGQATNFPYLCGCTTSCYDFWTNNWLVVDFSDLMTCLGRWKIHYETIII